MRAFSIKSGGRISHVQPCPQCGGALVIKLLSPVMFAPGLASARYVCTACETVKKQIIRRRVASPASRMTA
jgi:hypothetical protein